VKLYKLFFVLLLSTAAFAQTYQSGWGLGFGATSPRMFGDSYADYITFGGNISIQRDFDEMSSLRAKVDYLHFNENTAARTSGLIRNANGPKTNAVGLAVDYLFRFTPCSAIKAYVGAGGSMYYYKVDHPSAGISDKGKFGEIGVNIEIGATYAIANDWDVKLAASHHTISTDAFDGVFGAQGGVFGGNLDSYNVVEAGLIYYWDRGPASKYCELPAGVTPNYYGTSTVDYDRIQRMIDNAKPKPVVIPEVDYKRIEDIIDAKLDKIGAKQTVAPSASELALIGVNFDNNSSMIKSEEKAILAQVAGALVANPSVKVEVQGYTDNVGGERGNKALSEKRANAVVKFLTAKGVDASRLTAVGLGSSKPATDNKSADGRALNRRVEFKIVK
jgi:outer membrane protein OmpA-like peptidoglycan-associated protein